MTKYLLPLCCLWLSLAACTPHKIAIEQGNILKADMLRQLEIGMSKSQVEFILGTPVIKDSFNNDRWDYVYIMRPHKLPVRKKNLVLIFKGEHLASMSGSALKLLTEDEPEDNPDAETLSRDD
ncbi:outer membrane protein assembly factor BamE [Dasania sp. GY-MA-18]|uniref:Outer membrane protein assembly factor BamE n=1 Tax=Dasania phycosphaerae TaxID=2950436 RepID=A0A9J6RI80_9GAMM|nr:MULTISPECIES: outer membrane protein assembly factor BamE [Dasania]MCR8921265.1 outer membrane protein assembly factor BamE [Dasania sp. GY-MA-18]MCZ0863693.1 outer membrane protein assembly factor BamE [Dasania phycosphaerae]MCZ0867421.1 outer membrane protein assembly factor BamE [Dasania phycosphaerae]